MYALLVTCAFACDPTAARPSRDKPAPSESSARVDVSAPLSRYPAPQRLVAIGDVHGDLGATKRALALAGLLDSDAHWTGGKTVLVQTGDILDRGDDEQAILDLFERLQAEAKQAGGAVHVLNGNHELMNVAGDFRYVTPGGFADFADVPGLGLGDPALSSVPESQRARMAAFKPGGIYAKKLAAHLVVLVVGDSVFAHGGVLPKYARYGLERMNQEMAAWLLGAPSSPAADSGRALVATPDSPAWSRDFSDEPDDADCRLLEESLHTLGVARMVVGHTVMKTISDACGAKVWRIDVGMAAPYGGKAEALEIVGQTVRALRGERE